MKTEKSTFANYCGETVQILSTYQDDTATLCLVSYEDGREDEIPMRHLDFLEDEDEDEAENHNFDSSHEDWGQVE